MKRILNNKKVLFISLLLITMLGISLGYAYLSRNLNITGTTAISQNSWIFYFDNVVEKDNNVATENPALIEPEGRRKIDFNVPLESIQDTYEFNVDIVNAGSLKGQIDQIVWSNLTAEQMETLEFDIRYEDGTPILLCDVIEPYSRKTITVRVRLKEGKKYQTKEAETIPLSFEITYVQYDEERICESVGSHSTGEEYTLTIDPNGGTYNGQTEPYVVRFLYSGSQVNLGDNPILNNNYFTYWEVIQNDEYDSYYEEGINTITMKEKNAYVIAHYESAIGPYTLTIDPNGGEYNGTTDLTTFDNLQNGQVIYLGEEPTKEGKLFRGWKTIVNNQYNTKYNKRNNSVTIVDKSAYLEAEYGDTIAKNVETNKYYATIERALDAAEPGQTVLLLDDTEENPLNEKKLNRTNNEPVILDLGGHKVTGQLINNDILTLVDGTIENLDGVAAINNGTLTLGINDGEVDVDNIKLIGKNTNGGIGLKQKGIFNFYDGYLDAFIGLDGIFHEVPFEHYVFVDDDVDIDRMCQKVYVVERPERVVAKSVNENGGTMFYFNLQKAFDTSAQAYESGRKLVIEAIKNIPGEYALDLPEGKTAFFDLKGYTVDMGYILQNHGNLTIKDSGNETTGAKGEFKTSATMENYGTLTLKDVALSASTNVNLLDNRGSLNITNSTLTAKNGYVMEIKDGKSMTMDSTTTLKANSYALLLTNPNPFTIQGGNIEGIYNQGNLTVKDGTNIKLAPSSTYAIFNNVVSGKTTNLVFDGATIDIQSSDTIYGIYCSSTSNCKVTVNDGLINVVGTKSAYGIYSGSSIRLNGGTINVESTATGDYAARGIYTDNSNIPVVINNINMNIKSAYNSNARYAGAIAFENGKITINNGTINVENSNGIARIFLLGNATINDGTFTVDAKYAYVGAGYQYATSSWTSNLLNTTTVNGGDITVTATSDGRLFNWYTNVTINNGNLYTNQICFATGNTKTINGGTVKCNGNGTDSSNGNFVMTGGKFISETGTAVYANNSNATVTIKAKDGAEPENYPYIEGATNGVYINSVSNSTIDKAFIIGKDGYGLYTNSTTNIGTNDSNISREYPIIKGTTYGLYINGGTVNIYDGIFKGETWGYYGFVSGLPDGGEIVDDIETMDDSEINISYVQEQDNFLKIVETGEEYNSLQRAINAIEETGTVLVLEDHYIKNESTIAAGKNVTIDFDNHVLSVSKSITNNGTLILADSSEEKNGGIIKDGNSILVSNNGNLTIESGNYTSYDYYNKMINNNAASGKTTNFTMNGGTIEISYSENVYAIYNEGSGTTKTTINGGTIKVVGDKSAYGIYQGSSIIINDGTINVESTATGGYVAEGVYNSSSSIPVVINNVNMNIKSAYNSNSRSSGAIAFESGKITINNGTINAENSNGIARIFLLGTATINDGTITVNSKYAYIGYGYQYATSSWTSNLLNTTTVNGGNLTVTGTSEAFLFNYYTNVTINNGILYSDKMCFSMGFTKTINGGTVKCYGNGTDSKSGTVTMTGGKLISETGNGLYVNNSGSIVTIKAKDGVEPENYPYIEGATNGVYVNSVSSATIDKAIVVGKNGYGIYANSTTNIGTNDNSVSTEYPIIKGTDYGLYINAGTTNFYDGILKGTEAGYYGFIQGLADAHSIKDDTEEIDDVTYNTNYLIEQDYFVKVESTGVEYNSIQRAIDAIETEDTIIIMADHVVKTETTVPAGKNITIDFDNHTIVMTKTIVNNGNLILTDTSEDKNGGISKDNSTVIVSNKANLTINDGHYSSTNKGQNGIYIYADSNKTSTFTMNGGTIEIERNDSVAAIYSEGYGTKNINIYGGVIKVNCTNTGASYWARGVYHYQGTTKTHIYNIDNMEITSSNNSTSTNNGAMVFYNGTNIIDAGNYVITANDSIAQLQLYGTVTLNNGTYATTGKYAYFINASSSTTTTATINDGTININGQDAAMFTVYVTGTVNGGIIDSNHSCFYSNKSLTITGGTLTCASYGVYENYSASITVTMTGGSITSNNRAVHFGYSSGTHTFNMSGGTLISNNNYGIYAASASDSIKIVPSATNIENGKYIYIKGQNNGIYMAKGNLVLGTKDNVVNLDHITVEGGEYGAYLASGTTNSFYDGRLKGTVYGYTGTIKSIEAGTYIYEDNETIEDVDYIVNYLKDLSPVVMNTRTEEIYNDLQQALDETESGDTLKLIDDVQLFYPVTVNKNTAEELINATLDLDGFNIKSTNPITISSGATVNLINNNTNKSSKIYTGITGINLVVNNGIFNTDKVNYESPTSSDSRLIVTNNGGTTTIDHANMNSGQNVYTYSGGTTNINNSDLVSEKISIYDEGTTNVDNCTITAGTYGVYSYTTSNGTYNNSSITGNSYSFYKYNRASTQTLTDTDLYVGKIYNDKGTLNIVNDEKERITISITNQEKFLINKATTYIKNAEITEVVTKTGQNYYDYTSIENSSSLTFENVEYNGTSSNNGSFWLIKNTSSLRITDSVLDLQRTTNSSYSDDHRYVYGIHNNGTVNMTNSDIKIYDPTSRSNPVTYFYGIRNYASSVSNLNTVGIDISGGRVTYNLLHESTSTSNVLNDIDFKTSNVVTGYGLLLSSGTINLQTGSIQVGAEVQTDEEDNKTYVDKNVTNAYGLYVKNVGTNLLLGVQDTSENAGTADADVSIVNPLIIAKGSTTGIAVKKIDAYFKFYDGILMGNTAAKPEVASETDHINYTSTTYYDDDNEFEYCILEYVGNIVNKNNMAASMKDVYYTTMNAAINRSSAGDTVILQRSLEQNIEIPNGKEIIIDLNNHILSGTVTNNGTATIIDGEITNTGTTYNIAILNNGLLFIGMDDNQIIDDYVTILGNNNGILNNGKVYMYDGYIRGTTPVEGNEINTLYKYRIVNREIDEYDTVLVEEIPSATVTRETVYNYEYDEENQERIFTVEEDGYYLLETWGAQGGTANSISGGYGGYSKGIVYLESGDKLYINVGSMGKSTGNGKNVTAAGGYNGGGSGINNSNNSGRYAGSGGGATHIALSSGLLSTFENKQNELLIVSGGGSGSWYYSSTIKTSKPGHGGGYIGGRGEDVNGSNTNSIDGGTQDGPGSSGTIKGSFGQGANGASEGPGAGGGYYGGNAQANKFSSGGGSGYIGNDSLLSKGSEYKIMYGYGVDENLGNDVYTISTTSYSTLPEANKAKAGDGYARITKLIITES